MNKDNDFIKGFKYGLGIHEKGTIVLTLDEWCSNINELTDKVI